MALDVLVERVLPLPRARVADYAMDWRHDVEWTQGIDSVELTAEADGGGYGTGAEVTRTTYFLGRRIDYVFLVVAHEPQARLALRSVAGPFPMRVTYRFEDHPGGTLASIAVDGDVPGYLRLGAPALRLLIRSNARRDLRMLAENLTREA